VNISEIQIDGFGVWTDLSIGDLTEPLTVFYGVNEAGKTTLMQFVRTVLYGFSMDRRRRYLPPVYGGRAGGSLEVSTLNGHYRLHRTTHAGSIEDLGDISIVAGDGGMQGSHLLPSLLSNLDEQIFNNVFAIGLRELQELATLNDTEAAQQLYKLSSGMDRVSLVDVMSELEGSRQRILPAGDQAGELDKLLARRDKLRADIENASGESRRWGRLLADRKTLQSEAEQIEGRIVALEKESRAVEIAIQIQEKWRRRQALDEQLKRARPKITVDEETIARLDRLNHVISEREKRLESLRPLRQRLREEAAELPINTTLWNQRARVEALTEHATWIDTIRDHIRKIDPEIERLQEEWKQQGQTLGLSPQALTTYIATVNARTLNSLRGPARAARDDARRWKQAQLELESSRHQLGEMEAQIELELAERKQEQLPVALERAGDIAAKLRRRIQIEERLEKLTRHRQDLDEDCLELMEAPLMPLGQMVTWGAIVAVGVMLMLIAVFSDIGGSQRIPLIWFGAMCTAGGFFLKYAYQQQNNQELEECQRQLAQVKKHLKEATSERAEIDQSLPAGQGPLEARLKRAEEELRKLEALAPLETERAVAVQRVEDAQRRVQQGKKSLRESRQRWRAALAKLNLSEKLTPQHIRAMAEGNEKLSDLQKQIAAKKQEKADRQQQLASLSQRVMQLLKEAGLEASSDDPQEQLRQVLDLMAEQRRFVERRVALRKQDREYRRQMEHGLRSLENLQLKRQALFSQAGVDDEPDLRRLADQQHQFKELTRERASLYEQILNTIGIQCSEEAVERELTQHTNLQHRLEQIRDQLREFRTELTDAHQKRGELQQELKVLSQDRQLGAYHLELGVVDQQIAEAKRRWRLLATTGLVLESIRRIYETERQPETLNEASKYLKRFTEGRYTRVWAPLGKNALRVDDDQGRALGVELLSQGTREAVFLSLRLALVATYARRGAVLPLILDDVLVNLDVRRAKAAAAVLLDFAKHGHQVMLFTCHDHIVLLFEQMGVNVHELSRTENAGGRVMRRARQELLVQREPAREIGRQPEIIELEAESIFAEEATERLDEGTDVDAEEDLPGDEDPREIFGEDELTENDSLESDLEDDEEAEPLEMVAEEREEPEQDEEPELEQQPETQATESRGERREVPAVIDEELVLAPPEEIVVYADQMRRSDAERLLEQLHAMADNALAEFLDEASAGEHEPVLSRETDHAQADEDDSSERILEEVLAEANRLTRAGRKSRAMDETDEPMDGGEERDELDRRNFERPDETRPPRQSRTIPARPRGERPSRVAVPTSSMWWERE
jgi:uncharacterized protein YhaN